MAFLNPKNVTHIVIHTAAAARFTKGKHVAVDQTAKTIDDYHRSKGWDGIGYHEWIRMDGRVEEGRRLNKQGAHVEGFNSRSVGICCAGHGDYQPFTPEQWKSAVERTVWMLVHFDLVDEFKANPMRVIGHREINVLRDAGVTNAARTSKSCPGKLVDMTKFRQAVLAELARQGL